MDATFFLRSARTWPTARTGRGSGRKCRRANWSGSIWSRPGSTQHGLSGEVIATDGPYGNLVTNISGEDFLKLGYRHGQNVHVTLGKTEMNIPFVRTFSDVALKKPLLYIDSRGHLALAVNQGSFAADVFDPAASLDFLSAREKLASLPKIARAESPATTQRLDHCDHA